MLTKYTQIPPSARLPSGAGKCRVAWVRLSKERHFPCPLPCPLPRLWLLEALASPTQLASHHLGFLMAQTTAQSSGLCSASGLLSFSGGWLWGQLWGRLWEQLKGFSFGSLTGRRKDTDAAPCPTRPASPRHLSISGEPGPVQPSRLPPPGWVRPVGRPAPTETAGSMFLHQRLKGSRGRGRGAA